MSTHRLLKVTLLRTAKYSLLPLFQPLTHMKPVTPLQLHTAVTSHSTDVIMPLHPLLPPTFSFFFFFFFPFYRDALRHMEVPGLGVESGLQLPAYTTATAKWDLSRICDLCHSSWQHQILDPLSKARVQTCILTDTMSGS